MTCWRQECTNGRAQGLSAFGPFSEQMFKFATNPDHEARLGLLIALSNCHRASRSGSGAFLSKAERLIYHYSALILCGEQT